MSSGVSRESERAPASARQVFREMLQGSGLYSLALIGSQAASLLVLPVSTRYLTTADFGALDLLQQVSIVLSLLFGLNLSGSLGFFLSGRTDKHERALVVNTALAATLAIGVTAMLAAWPFATFLSEAILTSPIYAPYLKVVFVSVPLGFALDLGLTLLRVEDRSAIFATASLLRAALSVAGTWIGLSVFHLGIWGVLGSSVTAIVLVELPLVFSLLRRYPPTFEFATLRAMARFSLPLGLSGIALFIVHFGDRFIIPHFWPKSDLGIYALAYKFGMLLSLPQASFQSYWSAQVYRLARRDDADVVIARTFTYLTLVLGLFGLGLIVGRIPAVRLFTRPAFYPAAGLVPVIVAAYMLRGFGDFFRSLFLVKGRPQYDAVCNWIGSVVCLIAYFGLIPRWGIWGAAWATLIAFSIICLLSIVWSYRVYPYFLEVARLVKLAIAIAIPLAAYVLLPVSSVILEIAWGFALIGGSIAILLILHFPTPGEWETIHAATRRIRPKAGA